MSDFWAFRNMVTPVIIQILFWVGVIICVIAGLILIGTGIKQPGHQSLLPRGAAGNSRAAGRQTLL